MIISLIMIIIIIRAPQYFVPATTLGFMISTEQPRFGRLTLKNIPAACSPEDPWKILRLLIGTEQPRFGRPAVRTLNLQL